jgi:glycerate 2-kinase
MLAAGKASPGMAVGAAEVLGERLARGLVIAPEGVEMSVAIAGVDVTRGGHPVPTKASEDAGRRALALAKATAADDRFLVLLSGGASALMAVPVPPITLEDKQRTTERLLRNGADIHALNTVRKHLSAIKGGQLAQAAPAETWTFAISDVVGDDLSVIGSGPTVGDPTRFSDAYAALMRYGGVAGFPDHVVAHVKRGLEGDLADTPTAESPRLARSHAAVIGSRATAMTGAADHAHRLGFHVVVIDDPVEGEARKAAAIHVQHVRRLVRKDERRPICIVSSGETTVHVKGPGKGGRNQEFALALSESMAGVRASWVAASVGTDGVDGPTDAAGAIVDVGTAVRAAQKNLFPARTFLNTNNAYAYFSATGDLIHTGPTGTNVGDLQVFLLA